MNNSVRFVSCLLFANTHHSHLISCMSCIHRTETPDSYFIVGYQQRQQRISRLIYQLAKRLRFPVKIQLGSLFLFSKYLTRKGFIIIKLQNFKFERMYIIFLNERQSSFETEFPFTQAILLSLKCFEMYDTRGCNSRESMAIL